MTGHGTMGVMTTATLHTNQGDIVIELFDNHTPKTVRNFVELAEGTRDYVDPATNKPGSGPYYDGVIFHRIIEGFMIQTGDRTGTGRGGPATSSTTSSTPIWRSTSPTSWAWPTPDRAPTVRSSSSR